MCRLDIAINVLSSQCPRAYQRSFLTYIKGEPTDFQTMSVLYETDDDFDH
jgi:hypothetical protein